MEKGMATYRRAPVRLPHAIGEAVMFAVLVAVSMLVCYVVAPLPHANPPVSYLPEQDHE